VLSAHNFSIDTGKNEDRPTIATGLGYYGSCKNDRTQVHEGEEPGGYGSTSGYYFFTYHQCIIADDLMDFGRDQTRTVQTICDSIMDNLQMLAIHHPQVGWT
jgi:hypothetical protein